MFTMVVVKFRNQKVCKYKNQWFEKKGGSSIEKYTWYLYFVYFRFVDTYSVSLPHSDL